jgi:hypothetical protein
METIFIHAILGIILFFLINWIGKHSYSIGYMEISIFTKIEEAPALNFLIRVLTPIVYIIIISTTLYYFKLDKYVQDIFYVNIYYIIFRLTFNLITNRGLLLNWYKQFLYWSAIIIISYFVYIKIIKIKENILPDFTTLANELWIIILLFIFQITNNIKLSVDGTQKRKENYLRSRYKYFKSIYGKVITDLTKNEVLESIAYAILIYEDFNRPKAARIIENIMQKLTNKPYTLGVMQVKSSKQISDIESVQIGTKKIVKSYHDYLNELKNENKDFYEYSAYYSIIESYNGGSSYNCEVTDLISSIRENFYKKTNDTLEPKD